MKTQGIKHPEKLNKALALIDDVEAKTLAALNGVRRLRRSLLADARQYVVDNDPGARGWDSCRWAVLRYLEAAYVDTKAAMNAAHPPRPGSRLGWREWNALESFRAVVDAKKGRSAHD